MKILNASQIKAIDQFTIQQEPIASIDLMERAGKALFQAINFRFPDIDSVVIFCGPGNNGGDGLAVARLFGLAEKKVNVLILKGTYTPEFIKNLQKIKDLAIDYTEIKEQTQIDELNFLDEYFIDALFGIGLSRPLEGLAASLVQKINSFPNVTIALDLPSGLSPDGQFISTSENTIQADHTLSIQLPKLAFFFPENQPFTGSFECVDIGLSKEFIANQPTPFNYLDASATPHLIKPRPVTGHKGTFGHALIVAGSEGKSGAAILSSVAALKTGCGLLTSYVPETAITPLLSILPEAMAVSRKRDDGFEAIDLSKYDAIGFGPGVGDGSQNMLYQLLTSFHKPLVIDADGLTILANNKTWYRFLNPTVVLTPHPGEFDRLTQKHLSGFDRYTAQLNFSKTYSVTVLLKGYHTSITTPGGDVYFNSTGNNGMATAGSGDVLTGIITSLCAQGYTIETAAILGAYLHGYAGDIAAEKHSKTSLIASDIIAHLGDFFRTFER